MQNKVKGQLHATRVEQYTRTDTPRITLTVKEFAESFLTFSQQVRISELTSEYVYFEGRAGVIKHSDDVVYSARIQGISNYHSLDTPDGIEIYI